MTRAKLLLSLIALAIVMTMFPTFATDATPNMTLIVVQDLGGVSALPYYRALSLQKSPGH